MPTPFITSFTLGLPRNDYTGVVGFKFVVGGLGNIVVSSVGRWCILGNSGTHTVSISDDGNHTVLGSASINLSGATSAAFAYASITPITLISGLNYCCFSSETNGGDMWYDDNGTAVTTTTDAGVIDALYAGTAGDNTMNSGGVGTGKSYVPPNFQIGSAAVPFIPIIGRGPGMALASRGGLVARQRQRAASHHRVFSIPQRVQVRQQHVSR